MKRLSNIFVVLFAIAAMTSCYQDDIVLKPSYGSQSDVISFSANLSFTEDEISRSESVERIGRHLLCSEQDSITLPMGIYQQNGIWPGEQLIITHETADKPLNIRDIDAIIDHYLI